MVPAARAIGNYSRFPDVDPGRRKGNLVHGFDLARKPTRARGDPQNAATTGGLTGHRRPVTLSWRETEGEHGNPGLRPRLRGGGKPARKGPRRPRRYPSWLDRGVFRLADLVSGRCPYLQAHGVASYNLGRGGGLRSSWENAELLPRGRRPIRGGASGPSATRGTAEGRASEHRTTLEVGRARGRWSVRCFNRAGFVAGRRDLVPDGGLLAGLRVPTASSARLPWVASIPPDRGAAAGAKAFPRQALHGGLPHPVWVWERSWPDGGGSNRRGQTRLGERAGGLELD